MTGREYLLIFGGCLLVICVSLLLLGMGWVGRRRQQREHPRHYSAPAEPCDLAAAIREHVALADRHAEEIELGRAA